jgi:hypothetical protein
MDDHTNALVNWGAEAWRAPMVGEKETILFDECGRVLNHGDRYNVDYRSHYFRLVREQFGGYALYVKHGGGQERLSLSYAKPTLLAGMEGMTSDQRYLLFHTLYVVASDQADAAAQAMAQTYRKAFIEGRLKKRKRPGQESYKVWMES